MQKKIITLSILLLLLLLGLFCTSSSLAYEPEYSIDWVDVKNMMYLAYTDNGQNWTENTEKLSNLLEANKTQIMTLIDKFNSQKSIVYQVSGSNVNQYLYFTFSNNDGANLYTYNGYVLAGNGYQTYRIRVYGLSGGDGSFTFEGPYTNGAGFTMVGVGRYYCNSPLYTNSSGSAIFTKDGYTYNAGTNSAFLTGVFTRNLFEFTQNNNIDLVTVNDFHNCLYIRKNNWVNGFYNIGRLERYSNLEDITINRYRYNKTISSWNNFGTLEYGDFLFVNHYNSGDYADIELQSTNYSTGGYVYQINFIPKNLSLHNAIAINCYLESDNDIFNGSSLNTSSTFSGDFYNDYNNNSNNISTNESIDNVSNTLTDDSEVDNMLSDFFGNSGDNFLNDVGYNPLENPFVAICRTLIENINDCLLGSGNETISFTFLGNNVTLNSNDYKLPNGALKDFVTVVSNGLLFWVLIKYGFKLYEWIRSGRVKNWLRETLDKDIDDYFLF